MSFNIKAYYNSKAMETFKWRYDKLYSLRPTLFVLFEKSNILREHHLLSCLPYKNE